MPMTLYTHFVLTGILSSAFELTIDDIRILFIDIECESLVYFITSLLHQVGRGRRDEVTGLQLICIVHLPCGSSIIVSWSPS
jgi:hypothetical protein